MNEETDGCIRVMFLLFHLDHIKRTFNADLIAQTSIKISSTAIAAAN